MVQTLRFQGRVTPATKAEHDYILLPFDVPPGVRRLEITYSYERHGEETVIDLGLFDPRGATFLNGRGFRGWSGSARTHVVVTEESATPGYIPGPILPGTWHVILGIYKVASPGSAYEVTVLLSDDPGVPPHLAPKRKERESSRDRIGGPAWYRGDLHCHTHHSDAQASVEELRAIAQERGLDFVAVTDHNTVSHHVELETVSGDGLTLIPGEEVTTYYGHANVWGIRSWVDFRCRTPDEMRQVFHWALSRGGVVSINHPKPGGPPWEFGYDLPFTCLEVWHGYPHANHVPLQVWEKLLQSGRRVVAVGGSDAHLLPPAAARTFPIRLGRPTTYVWARDRSAEAILAGIRHGTVVISCDVDGPFLEVWAWGNGHRVRVGEVLVVGPGDTVTLEVRVHRGRGGILEVIQDGEIVERQLVSQDLWEHTAALRALRSGYVRVQLAAQEKDPRVWSSLPLLALANPIYLEVLSL